MLGFWDWPEGERRGGQRWVGQKAGCRGAGNRLGVLGGGTLCWGLLSSAVLCDPGEVTVSLWALSLQSEGLEARLLFPILNTLCVWSSAVKRLVLLSLSLPSALPPAVHSFIPSHSMPTLVQCAEDSTVINTGPALGAQSGSRQMFNSQ